MAGKIVPIVEGDGEITAVPALLHRLLEEQGEHGFRVATPKNAHGAGNLTREGGIERFVQYAWLEPDCAAVLILIDGDGVEDCPAKFASALAKRVQLLSCPRPVAIVIANREYEAWFLASITSFLGKQITDSFRFPSGVAFTGDPEAVRDVKGWITRQLPRGKAYKETDHQAPMTRLIALDVARAKSRSFRRICNALKELVQAAVSGRVVVTPTRS